MPINAGPSSRPDTGPIPEGKPLPLSGVTTGSGLAGVGPVNAPSGG